MSGGDGTDYIGPISPVDSVKGFSYPFRNRVKKEEKGTSGNIGLKFCQCPQCGTRLKQRGEDPYKFLKCPQCGSAMVRS